MLFAMTTGHIAWVFVPLESLLGQLMHFFARLTMPLACFLVIEGFTKSKDLKGYIKRMFKFALLAQIPYITFFVGIYRLVESPALLLAQFNVLFTLGFGLLFLCCLKGVSVAHDEGKRLLYFLATVPLLFISTLADWGLAVIVWVVAIYFGRAKGFLIATVALFLLGAWADGEGVFALLEYDKLMDYGLFMAAGVMAWYDKNKEKSPLQYRLPRTFFYWYYVVHLMVLGLFMQFSPWAIDEAGLVCHEVCTK